ncbi:MAG: PTS fructose transporter subunit IIA [Wenzhouxiangellaceae bacterium]|nr:PTS fructose transporter subunit IIA [Wenzhouxiangellaceae bacterium]
MTPLLLVTHEGFGESLCALAETILGWPPPVIRIEVAGDDDPDLCFETIRHRLGFLCRDVPPLVLTDLPGATPHNLALEAIARLCPTAPVVTGLNLPMLLSAVTHLDLPAAVLAARVAEGGREAIFVGGADAHAVDHAD